MPKLKLKDRIPAQLHRNAVALISLVVAISSLSYNSYRNELSEENRNVRFAAFTVLKELGEFQQLVLRNRYFEIDETRDRVEGYGKAAMVRDLTLVMPKPAPDTGAALFEVWDDHADGLFASDAATRARAEQSISERIEQTRVTVLDVLKSLE